MVYTVCKKKIIAHGLPVGAPPGKNVKLRLWVKQHENHLSGTWEMQNKNIVEFAEKIWQRVSKRHGYH